MDIKILVEKLVEMARNPGVRSPEELAYLADRAAQELVRVKMELAHLAELEKKIERGELVEVVSCGKCRFCLEGVCYGRGLNKGKETSPTGFCDRGKRK